MYSRMLPVNTSDTWLARWLMSALPTIARGSPGQRCRRWNSSIITVT